MEEQKPRIGKIIDEAIKQPQPKKPVNNPNIYRLSNDDDFDEEDFDDDEDDEEDFNDEEESQDQESNQEEDNQQDQEESQEDEEDFDDDEDFDDGEDLEDELFRENPLRAIFEVLKQIRDNSNGSQ